MTLYLSLLLFVFIHPFSDENGRLHRLLIHYLFPLFKLSPNRSSLPISAVILNSMDKYTCSLEEFYVPLKSCVRYTLDEKTGVMEVLNETDLHYRYFDATQQAEYLYWCVGEGVTLLEKE